jgi:hypothetical protein
MCGGTDGSNYCENNVDDGNCPPDRVTAPLALPAGGPTCETFFSHEGSGPDPIYNGLTTNGVPQNWDCTAKFKEHWCDSGYFGNSVAEKLCPTLKAPPYLCFRTSKRFDIYQLFALAWSNAELAWTVCIAMAIFLLRRRHVQQDHKAAPAAGKINRITL